MALDYFRERAAAKLPGVFNSEFWDSIIFQASFAEPAVLHAVIALGAMHRHKWSLGASLEKDGPMRSNEPLALQHYNKAIGYLLRHGESRDQRSLRPVLVSCVVFICIELLRGRFETARAHLRGGLKLLNETQSHPEWTSLGDQNGSVDGTTAVPPQHASVDDLLVDTLIRLNVQSGLLGQGAGCLQDILPGYSASATHRIPRIFRTAGAARRHLDRLVDSVSHISAQTKSISMHCHIPECVVQEKELLQTSLARWLCTYTSSLPSLTSNANIKTTLSLLLLRLYHTMASLMASTCLRLTDETIFDLHTQEFTDILAQAVELFRKSAELMETPGSGEISSLGFTVDMGYLPALYYVALKCRVPRLRRQAIELLRSAPHREGVWDGEVAAYAAELVMEMEEGGCDKHAELGTDGVPSVLGKDRINHVTILLPNGAGEQAALVCERWKCGEEGVVRASWTRRFDLSFCKAWTHC